MDSKPLLTKRPYKFWRRYQIWIIYSKQETEVLGYPFKWIANIVRRDVIRKYPSSYNETILQIRKRK